jgi:hypothetical protein
VSPGTYTVALTANGVTVKQQVRVLGDSLLPLTQAQYRDRESFLVDLLGVQNEAYTLARDGKGRARTAAARVLRRANTMAGDFNGSGARPGTMYPPTPFQRNELAEMRKELADVRKN